MPYNDDVNLVGFYQVLIYYSNGMDQPGYGGVCADDSYREEATVICNQMGYEHADFAYRYVAAQHQMKKGCSYMLGSYRLL